MKPMIIISLIAIAMLAGCLNETGYVTYTCKGICEQNSTHEAVCPEGIERTVLPSGRVKCEVEQEKEEEKKMTNRYALIETNKGNMKIELYEQRAPITTKNFIDLTNKGFYNGLKFHRIIEDFMIQGGDPKGDGTGGPGYEIQDEFHPELKHDSKGILSMANAGPNTGGSQFFITLVPTPWLDGKHAVFGKLVEGEEVLDAIGQVKTDAGDKPLEPVVMNKVTIVEA